MGLGLAWRPDFDAWRTTQPAAHLRGKTKISRKLARLSGFKGIFKDFSAT